MDLDFLIPIAFFFACVYVIKTISDNRVRNKLIEQGKIDEDAKYLFSNIDQKGWLSALKWGLVLVGIGLAFLFGQLFGPELRMRNEITVGCIFLFPGIALLIYYFVARNIIEKNE